MTRRWQYQSEANPLQELSSGAFETVSPAKWMPEYPNPTLPARMLCVAIVAGSLFAPPLIESTIPDTTSYSGNISYTRRLQYQSFCEPLMTLPYTVPTDILTDTWFLPECNQPVLKLPERYFQEGVQISVGVETPDLYQWQQPTQQPIQQPIFPPRNNYWIAECILDWGEIAVPEIFEFQGELEQPIFPAPRLADYEGSWDIDWFTLLPISETVTVDKWFTPIEQPRDCERRQYLYPPYADRDMEPVPPEVVLFPSWYQETCQPIFLRAVPVAEGIFVTDLARYYVPGAMVFLFGDANRLIMDDNHV